LAKFIEMPPPIVPAPMTPTDLIGRVLVPAGSPLISQAFLVAAAM
jgi:hypothetical protein